MFNTTKKRGEGGFTLIELLVVIAIIGLLSSVILASLNGARRKGRDARRMADLKEIQVALELYYGNQTNPAYPATIAALAPLYISVEPKDPNTGASYAYAIAPGPADSATGKAAANGYYCIGATLEATTPSNPDTCNATALGTTAPTGTFRVGP